MKLTFDSATGRIEFVGPDGREYIVTEAVARKFAEGTFRVAPLYRKVIAAVEQQRMRDAAVKQITETPRVRSTADLVKVIETYYANQEQ